MELIERLATERRVAELGRLIGEIDEALDVMKVLQTEASSRRTAFFAERVRLTLLLNSLARSWEE